jgi:uncharacterized protein (UPF0332 family)
MAGITRKNMTRILRVSEAPRQLVKDWKEGVSLEGEFACSIDDLLRKSAVARWRLGSEQLRDGKALLRLKRPVYRSAVSRFYYAMYHAFRAVTYLNNRGDDYQGHSDLPQSLPQDFPALGDWKLKLKNARLERNRADYESYPKSHTARARIAAALQSDATEALRLTRQYLLDKGCAL